jgi:hypothetical protein
MTGALHVELRWSSSCALKIAVENCCTSINEYNQEKYQNNIRCKREWITITSIKNKISENELLVFSSKLLKTFISTAWVLLLFPFVNFHILALYVNISLKYN